MQDARLLGGAGGCHRGWGRVVAAVLLSSLGGWMQAADAGKGVPAAADAFTRETSFALYIDASRIRGTGFWKALEAQLPAIQEDLQGKMSLNLGTPVGIDQLKGLPEFPWESLAEVAIAAEGPLSLGGQRKPSKDSGILAVARFAKGADVGSLLTAVLGQLEREKPGTRDRAEKTRRKVGQAEMMDLPAELFSGQEVPFTMSLAGVSAGDATLLGIGRRESVQALLERRGGGGGGANARRYVPPGAQVWLYAPVPAEATQALAGGDNPLAQANPMLGPMAQGLKDVRDVAFALTFGERNLDMLLALGCVDGKASAELGAGLQGFLGFIQTAAAQNPGNSPSALRNLKVAVEGGAVRVTTSMSQADLTQAVGGGRGRTGQASTPAAAPRSTEPEVPVKPPVTAEFAGLVPGEGESVRWGRVRFQNSGDKSVREAQLRFVYLDKSGRKLGEWMRRHTDLEGEVVVAAGATRVSQSPVFQMPAGTDQVTVSVMEVLFTDGTRWKATR